MRLQVTVRKLNMTDRETDRWMDRQDRWGSFQYLWCWAFGAAGDKKTDILQVHLTSAVTSTTVVLSEVDFCLNWIELNILCSIKNIAYMYCIYRMNVHGGHYGLFIITPPPYISAPSLRHHRIYLPHPPHHHYATTVYICPIHHCLYILSGGTTPTVSVYNLGEPNSNNIPSITKTIYSTPPWLGVCTCRVLRKYMNASSSYSVKTKCDGQTDRQTGCVSISPSRAFGAAGDKNTYLPTLGNYHKRYQMYRCDLNVEYEDRCLLDLFRNKTLLQTFGSAGHKIKHYF